MGSAAVRTSVRQCNGCPSTPVASRQSGDTSGLQHFQQRPRFDFLSFYIRWALAVLARLHMSSLNLVALCRSGLSLAWVTQNKIVHIESRYIQISPSASYEKVECFDTRYSGIATGAPNRGVPDRHGLSKVRIGTLSDKMILTNTEKYKNCRVSCLQTCISAWVDIS
jgi:hypothetical protein